MPKTSRDRFFVFLGHCLLLSTFQPHLLSIPTPQVFLFLCVYIGLVSLLLIQGKVTLLLLKKIKILLRHSPIHDLNTLRLQPFFFILQSQSKAGQIPVVSYDFTAGILIRIGVLTEQSPHCSRMHANMLSQCPIGGHFPFGNFEQCFVDELLFRG